jgi:hypothetical protein
VCTFIAAQAGMWMELKPGQQNPMLEAAQRVSILPDPPTPEEAELEEMRGPRVADRLEDDPRFQKEKMVLADPARGVEASNPRGTFEALMNGWGPSSHGPALDTKAAQQG